MTSEQRQIATAYALDTSIGYNNEANSLTENSNDLLKKYEEIKRLLIKEESQYTAAAIHGNLVTIALELKCVIRHAKDLLETTMETIDAFDSAND